jgi:hypothetical protein
LRDGSVVAQADVGTNETYRFALAPGDYVLRSGVASVNIKVGAGDDLYVDIPDECI